MSRPWMGYLAGAAFVLSTAGAVEAYAQGAPPAASSDRVVEREVIVGDGHDRGDRREERRVIVDGDHHRDHAEHLRTMLQLKPAQEGALTAYLAATAPEHRHERIVEMSDRADAKTTPQRLAEMETHMAEQAAQGHARIEATRKFYDQLEPSQKKVFDEMPMLMIGPMGPMMNMGGMKVMVNMEGMPPLPPLPPLPPRPPHAPPAPPAPPTPRS
jgi:hypothetical protein